MIKSELVQRVAGQSPHLYQRDVENIVNAVLGEIVARWPEAIALSCAASELFTSKFARRERPAIPEPALSCLCRRKHSRFLGVPEKFASGSTRARSRADVAARRRRGLAAGRARAADGDAGDRVPPQHIASRRHAP